MSKQFLKVDSLTKKYRKSDVFAIKDVSFDIVDGSVFGLLGPNGAGKSTILSIISGLFEPTSGSFSSDTMKSDKKLHDVMGVAPQVPALYEELSAMENLIFFGNLHSIKGTELKDKSNNLLKKIGLIDQADIQVKKFSTGMKQRLNLGVALISTPSFLLLDEPTAGVDPQSRNRIFEIISQFKADGGTIIYTTHYMEEAERLCDRVAIIDHGKVLVIGTPAELIDKYGACQVTLYCPNDMEHKNLDKELIGIDGITYAKKQDKLIDLRVKKEKISKLTIEGFISEIRKIDNQLSLKSFREPSIEAVFLELTGTELRDEL